MKGAISTVNKVMFNQKTFWVMLVSVIVLVMSYIYFIHATVQNVAARQRAEKALTEVTSNIASLESHYMRLTGSVNIAEAYNMGFKNTSSDETKFIKRKPALGSLSGNSI
jgi:ABC-type uncharacterized transport system permease subunit